MWDDFIPWHSFFMLRFFLYCSHLKVQLRSTWKICSIHMNHLLCLWFQFYFNFNLHSSVKIFRRETKKEPVCKWDFFARQAKCKHSKQEECQRKFDGSFIFFPSTFFHGYFLMKINLKILYFRGCRLYRRIYARKNYRMRFSIVGWKENLNHMLFIGHTKSAFSLRNF